MYKNILILIFLVTTVTFLVFFLTKKCKQSKESLTYLDKPFSTFRVKNSSFNDDKTFWQITDNLYNTPGFTQYVFLDPSCELAKTTKPGDYIALSFNKPKNTKSYISFAFPSQIVKGGPFKLRLNTSGGGDISYGKNTIHSDAGALNGGGGANGQKGPIFTWGVRYTIYGQEVGTDFKNIPGFEWLNKEFTSNQHVPVYIYKL